MSTRRGLKVETTVYGFWLSVLMLIGVLGFVYVRILEGQVTVPVLVLMGWTGAIGLAFGGIYVFWKLDWIDLSSLESYPAKLAVASLAVIVVLALKGTTSINQAHVFFGGVGWLAAVVAGRGYYVYGTER